MQPALELTLNALLVGLFAASIVYGFACSLCTLYGAILLSSAQKSLLQTLKELAPAAYARLHDPFWRNHITLWQLSTLLKSQELDDVPDIHRAKERCRRALRWQIRGVMGFLAAWAFGFTVGALAIALGSTLIRASG
jgi:hypothetical protein